MKLREDPINLAQDSSKTSRNAKKIEEELHRNLNTLVNSIKSEPRQFAGNPSLLRRKYNVLVNETIRGAVGKAYDEGMRYVAEYESTQHFTTDFDLEQIKKITTKYINIFWEKMSKDIVGRNDTLLYKNDYMPKDPLNTNKTMTAIATGIVFSTLNVATVLKTRQLMPRSQVLEQLPDLTDQSRPKIRYPRVKSAATSEVSISPMRQSQTDEEELVHQTVLVWETSVDDKVCPICEDFDGETYQIDDFDIPMPPDSSHPNCRCRLVLGEE